MELPMGVLLLAAIMWMQGAPQVQRLGTISGRILAMNGEPADRVRVSAMQVADGAAAQASVAIMGVAQTDSEGRFRLQNVPAGKYYIAVGRMASPTYFPGVADMSEAKIVALAAGESIEGFDFKMVLPPPLNISGRLSQSG